MALTPQAIYVWQASTNQWVPWSPESDSTTVSTSFLGQPTPIAFYVFNKGTNQFVPWDGNISSGLIPGGITAVIAGTGLSGGGTSGPVTVSLAIPVSVADGGTGTTTPSLVAGSGISISGSWPDQTITNTGGGGGGGLDFTPIFLLMGA